MEAAFEEAAAWKGHVDVAVCTPGVNVRKPLLDYTGADFDRVVGTNLKGTLHVLQAAGRIMAGQGSGSIVKLKCPSSPHIRTTMPAIRKFNHRGVS